MNIKCPHCGKPPLIPFDACQDTDPITGARFNITCKHCGKLNTVELVHTVIVKHIEKAPRGSHAHYQA